MSRLVNAHVSTAYHDLILLGCEVPAAPEYLASLKNKNAQLGMIRFRVYRASAFTKIAGLGPGPDFYNDQDIEDATIPEKALKGHLSSHHTR